METRINAEPEFIVRQDEEFGRWTIDDCPPERGLPSTDIVSREMTIPMDDDEVARAIRAHEVMHSKISPGTRYPEWVKRGWASDRAMRAVEEVRVNHLCDRIGVPVKQYLKDGGERSQAERTAELNKWSDAVYGVVINSECASLPEYIKGIKKHKPEWVKPLKAISKKIVKELKDVHMSELSSTEEGEYCPAPMGFAFTEKLATWLDNIAKLDPDEAQRNAEESEKKAPISEEEIMKSKPGHNDDDDSAAPYLAAWGQLNPTVATLDKTLPGSIARKRRASATGRNPRRIHRMLTDPERRIFDTRSRGKGGIILIDASGSMSFQESDIYEILINAPGALVAMYAENNDGSSGRPNLYVLAKDGKMVSEIPERQSGNNVDYPALVWAVMQRSSNKTPIIWVTDGAVTSVNGDYYDSLALQCFHFCKKERIMVANDVHIAKNILADLKVGRKPKWVWPQLFHSAHRKLLGKKIS